MQLQYCSLSLSGIKQTSMNEGERTATELRSGLWAFSNKENYQLGSNCKFIWLKNLNFFIYLKKNFFIKKINLALIFVVFFC